MKTQTLYTRYFKRLIDFACAFLAILVLCPVLCVIAILVRFKLGSPVIFKQERPGKIDIGTGKEKIFCLYKFRTMTDKRDAEGNLLPDEQRLTPFGMKLRSTSLDELPELFNILKGDMSFVGPRPLLTQYLPLYSDSQRHRHDVRPGITGLAQINGRNSISWEERFAWDLEYVQNQSIGKDIKILLNTIMVVFKREGITSDTSVTMEVFTGNKDSEDTL